MNILVLGRFTSYILHSAVAVLTRHGHKVTALNVAPTYHLTKIYPLDECNQPLMLDFYGSAGSVNHVKNIATQKSVDLIYALWGKAVEKEIQFLLEVNVGIPIVWSLHCFPQTIHFGYVRGGVRNLGTKKFYLAELMRRFYKEWHTYRTLFPHVQGLVFANAQMLRFATILGLTSKNNLVLPDYLSATYRPRTSKERLSKMDGEPHVVYIGTPRFSLNRYDDVRKDLLALAETGIHVHFAEPDVPLPSHCRLHTFRSFGPIALARGELSNFMTQFDANVVMYHPWSKRRMRWRTTLPVRFLHGLLVGIPIALPRGVFTACEHIVSRHQVGYLFRDPYDLAEWLKGTSGSVEAVREKARRMAPTFTGEAHAEELTSFFEKVTNGGS